MLYDLAIAIYDILVHLAAPFSRKPRKMMKGHWVVYELLRQQLEKDVRYIWFHAASLGEFEQGRPLIEKIRAKYPDYGILLTFFSPSGYEVRKNYRGRRCLLPAFRQAPQCEEVLGYRESLHGILHQVRVLEELSGRTAQAPYSGVQHFFHFPPRTSILQVVWRYVQTCAARLRPFVCAE